MGVYQEPHLTRGIVKTLKGTILVSCGLDEAADEHRRAAGSESLRRTETSEEPPGSPLRQPRRGGAGMHRSSNGVPSAAAAQAAPNAARLSPRAGNEASPQTTEFTTGGRYANLRYLEDVQALGPQRVGREIESRNSIKWTARG